MKTPHGKQTETVRFVQFFIRYRFAFLLTVVMLFVAAIGIGCVTVILNTSHKKRLAEIDAISFKLTSALNRSSSVADNVDSDDSKNPLGGAAKNEADEKAKSDMRSIALGELEPFASAKNIVGTRGNMLKAELFFQNKQWAEARDAWLLAASIQPKAYTARLAWYNAAVCCEELGDTDGALSYYAKAANDESFLLKTHAIANMGRIKDESGDYEGAALHYAQLANRYPDDLWAELAQSRLIALRAEKRIQ